MHDFCLLCPVSSHLDSIPVSELPEYVRMVNREVVGGFKDEYGVRL